LLVDVLADRHSLLTRDAMGLRDLLSMLDQTLGPTERISSGLDSFATLDRGGHHAGGD